MLRKMERDTEVCGMIRTERKPHLPHFMPAGTAFLNNLRNDIARRGRSGAEEPQFGKLCDFSAALRPLRPRNARRVSFFHPQERVRQEELRGQQVEIGRKLAGAFQIVVKRIPLHVGRKSGKKIVENCLSLPGIAGGKSVIGIVCRNAKGGTSNEQEIDKKR